MVHHSPFTTHPLDLQHPQSDEETRDYRPILVQWTLANVVAAPAAFTDGVRSGETADTHGSEDTSAIERGVARRSGVHA